MQAEKHWFLVLIPLLLTLAAPLRWLVGTWTERNDALGFQPFVLFGVAYLIYAERHTLSQTYHGLAEVYPDGHRIRRGTPLVIYIGCLVLFLSYLTTVEMFAVIGFWIAAVGVVLYIYGFTILRGLWRPFLFAATMIPPPHVLLDLASSYLQRGCAAVAGAILHLIYPQTNTIANVITIGSYTAQVSGASSGIGILLPVLVLTLFLALLRKIRWTITLILLVSAALISLLTNTLRIVAMGIVGVNNPVFADAFHDAPAFLFAALAFYLTFLLAGRIGPRRSRAFEEEEWEE